MASLFGMAARPAARAAAGALGVMATGGATGVWNAPATAEGSHAKTRRVRQLPPGFEMRRDATGAQYNQAITAAKTKGIADERRRGVFQTKKSAISTASVDVYPAEDYEQMQRAMIANREGKLVAGAAVKESGDIVSLFKDAEDGPRGAAGYLLEEAVEEMGGDHLDCFRGPIPLPYLYAQSGFVPVAKVKFNREFAPPDWNYERDGEPDIVFMVYNPDHELVKKLKGMEGLSKEELAGFKKVFKQDVKSMIDALDYSEDYDSGQAVQTKESIKLKTELK